MSAKAEQVTAEQLAAFADAWNRHDVDGLMTFMTDDCIFDASSGPFAFGSRFEGYAAVRAAYAGIFTVFPDARWSDANHFVSGSSGLSHWLFTGTKADGSRVEVHGCDVFTFKSGKIFIKDSYRKQRVPPG
jgi:hypothetical protein